MVDTKDQSNAIVHAMLFVDSVYISTENYSNVWGCLLISLHACIDSVDIWHTLDLAKVTFLANQFLAGRFSKYLQSFTR